MDKKGEILIYQNSSGNIKIDVHLQDATVWLTQDQMALLFGKNKRTISEHILNIFNEGELNKTSVVRNFRITASDEKKYKTNFYNLDIIISVGYRVKSQQGTQFRIWATQRLREYKKLKEEQNQLQKEQSLKEIEADIKNLKKKK